MTLIIKTGKATQQKDKATQHNLPKAEKNQVGLIRVHVFWK